MSLPVSQYEALLAEVRGLRRKAQRVQQLATPLLTHCSFDVNPVVPHIQQNDTLKFTSSSYKMEPLMTGRQHNGSSTNCDGAATSSADGDTTCSEDEYIPGRRSVTHMSVSSEPVAHRDHNISMLYHGTWPVERTMWNSDPIPRTSAPVHNPNMQEVTSVMSFASSSGGALMGSPSLSRRSSQQLEAKVDMVYSLLAMLSGQEHADMGETLLALSTNPESCLAMRQSGCIPLLVQMVQSDKEPEARKKASQALQNLVHSQPDEKMRKREVRVFKLLEHARAYTEALKNHRDFELEVTSSSSEDDDRHPVQTVAHLMKLSFDELHRQAICSLGGIHTIANLVEAEHVNHGSTADEQHCILMRRYACMALTNLTFGDSGNKALLCSFREFMRALVIQLQSPSDELRQVTASVLRNLSWRADSSSKDILREVGSVTGLMKAAMLDNKENTLKSILSALWNLSAHCTENKSEICSVEGALGFLVDMLTYKTASKSLAIIENSGGILRNISSQIAVRDDYREILRQHNCLQILLDQLKSPSLTIVSNACGTLWNLSAKCATDQEALWQMGAPAMLRSLNHSKHKMIAMGSSAALKNLLSARPTQTVPTVMDSTALAMDLPVLPTLGARKQKALLQDLDQTLSETYENIEKDSPVKAKDDKIGITTHDFIQNTKKYTRQSSEDSPEFKYDDYGSEFSSLTIGEASTSYETKQNLSLPYLDNSVSSNDLNKNSFMKCRLTRNVHEIDNRSFNVYSDSGLQSLDSPVRFDLDSGSSSSIDNDKCKKREFKLKEISVYSDEKDHCSIEDVSDSDNQSSFGMEHKLIHDDSSILLSGLVARKEVAHPSAHSTPTLPRPNFKYPNVSSSNVTMFEGDIDEIDMDDISIHFAPEIESQGSEDNSEKCDVEQEKKSHLQEIVEETCFDNRRLVPPKTPTRMSSIPLPRSLPRPIPISNINHQPPTIDLDSPDAPSGKKTTKSNIARLSSGLSRRSLHTSTPLRIIGNAGRGEGSSETPKVENIDTTDENLVSPIVQDETSKRVLLSTDIEWSSPEVEIPSSKDLANVKPPQEDHSSSSEPLEQMDKPLETSPTDYSYLNPDACVNFSVKDERDRLLERSCEENKPVDNRMLDPDAMIESLDRFTAELVSQASHLQSNGDDKYKDNTWNDDTSPNEVTFPSISGSAPNVITFDSNDMSLPETSEENEKEKETEHQSNDFSSLNTNTSTMTESTLIAIEATKMATVFKNEAEMSHSISSVTSLELDKVQPPSLLESMNSDVTKSPKLTARKKSLPKGFMVRRALSNSLNNGSSLESLENHSLSNLDQVNPPSAMGELLDMDGSVTSVASLPSENNEMKTDFIVNGTVNKNSFLTSKLSHLMTNTSHIYSVTDLENINPPSLFNEITDLCNSLADVPTEAIGSETELFEDCQTHVLPTEDDVTEFSDANSATPIQSDISSPEVSPKKNKSITRPMTFKQRRNLARDRYKTYTIAAEMLTRENEDKQSTSDDFKTVACSLTENYHSVIDSHTNVKTNEKLTPKERRQNDRSRFETQVVEEAVTGLLQQPVIERTSPKLCESPQSSPGDSPARTKLSIRRNFMQKRLENKDRFKTQTLSGQSFSPELGASTETDLHMLVQKEANLVLKSLRETKTSTDELLDCETLSLVSNDDDSEQNSGSPVNYRTYHKSWGLSKNIPVIEPPPLLDRLLPPEPELEQEPEDKQSKPKIVKPSDEEPEEETPQNKAIRGRRKPLYSKTTKVTPKIPLKPIKNMTSNLVKNVTSSIKQVKQIKTPVTKPPTPQSRASSGYGTRSSSPKTSSITKPKIERQGTFTKEEPVPGAPKSRIPTAAGSAKPASKIPAKTRTVTSASSDRLNKNVRTTYARSTSADSTTRRPQSARALVKRASVPPSGQKTASNTSLNSTATSTKKQVTSKIASLWKKIEETKNKQPVKKDTRVWIQPQGQSALKRSNTFDNKTRVTLRGKQREEDEGKRVSRLGSFIVMDDNEEGVGEQQVLNAE